MGSLKSKIKSFDQPVIFYELTPPQLGTADSSIQAYVECAAELVNSTSIPVDAFNLPEIRSEKRNGERAHPFQSKMDPRQLALRLRKTMVDQIDISVNRCTVYEGTDIQKDWLEDTYNLYSIENLILVGGDSSKASYEGPSILDMLHMIHTGHQKRFFCGGITIPTRRAPRASLDEPIRLLKKGQCGIEFFTSQVLYEPVTMQTLLKDYSMLCEANEVVPKRVILSFAPVSSRRDIEFLSWLGVEIPESVEKRLLQANIGIGWRSIQITKEILEQILEYVDSQSIRVPLGLNIEHVTQHNFELTKELIEQLGKIYYQYYSGKS